MLYKSCKTLFGWETSDYPNPNPNPFEVSGLLYCQERALLYKSRESLFGWETSDYPQLLELFKAIKPHQTLWSTAAAFSRAYPQWLQGPFLELNADQAPLDSVACAVASRSVRLWICLWKRAPF